MKTIPIYATPNQRITFVDREVQYEIRIETRKGTVSFDIVVDNVDVVLGARAVINTPIVYPVDAMPDRYFMVYGLDNELVDYKKFGTSQILLLIYAEDFDVALPAFPIPSNF